MWTEILINFDYFFPTHQMLMHKVYEHKVAAPDKNTTDNTISSEEIVADVDVLKLVII
jgi:hypothetical protein